MCRRNEERRSRADDMNTSRYILHKESVDSWNSPGKVDVNA